jgi:hypothetical protein
MQTVQVVGAQQKLFHSPQAESDAVVMTEAFAAAEAAPDYMSKMRLAAEYFRKNAPFSFVGQLNEAESRQDVFVVTRAFHSTESSAMSASDRMKWIACCFRVQAVNALAPVE